LREPILDCHTDISEAENDAQASPLRKMSPNEKTLLARNQALNRYGPPESGRHEGKTGR
jgi:hypothetical protein